MQRTRIEWCDMTWNPISGCLHNCTYCYARRIAQRFSGHFSPTFHENRLDEPQKVKKPQSIFVCSMADLFGYWVPESWIYSVLEACNDAPWHNYLFLTKNPKRYLQFEPELDNPNENMWLGTSASTCLGAQNRTHEFDMMGCNKFISLEPLHEDVCGHLDNDALRWVIVGAETGNRKGKVVPKREWIERIANYCHALNIPLFMKNSLAPIWGEPLIQEMPEGLKKTKSEAAQDGR